MNEYRVLVCGDRHWTNFVGVKELVQTLKTACDADNKRLIIIEGEARGADTFARLAAESLGVEVRKFPAAWETHDREGLTSVPCRCPEGKRSCLAAGPRRNIQMVEEGEPHMVVAFHNDINTSKGTKHMIETAKNRGITWYVLSEKEPDEIGPEQICLELDDQTVARSIRGLKEILG